MIASIPGPDRTWSPTRTRPWPWTLTLVDTPSEPIGSGYGTPETEFTIWQMEPAVASGCPDAVAAVCSTATMTPLSGGPAAPGERTTAQPIDTGGPGIVNWG